MTRLAVLASHPVQYTAPLFRRLAGCEDLDLSVLYCSRLGTVGNTSSMENFGQPVVWDIDLLSGYEHRFLPGAGAANPQRRWSMTGRGLLAELRPEFYDLLVNFGWAYPADWLSFAICHRRRIPFLLLGDTDVRDRGTLASGRLRHVVLSALCRAAAGGLYTGTFNRDFYIRHGMDPTRLWFSPYAIDNDRFASGSRESAREALKLDERIVYFLFVGTLIPRKRPLDLLNAVVRLQARGERVGAIFAGSGQLQGELERAVRQAGASDIHLLGFVNQSRLPSIYAAADVFVLPSEKEPHGAVVNEAMAAGLPAIVSSGTGLWGPGDLIRHGTEGLVFRASDVDQLTRACELLLDGAKRTRMSALARERVRIWSYETVAEGWREAARAVVEDFRRRGTWGGAIDPPAGLSDRSAVPLLTAQSSSLDAPRPA